MVNNVFMTLLQYMSTYLALYMHITLGGQPMQEFVWQLILDASDAKITAVHSYELGIHLVAFHKTHLDSTPYIYNQYTIPHLLASSFHHFQSLWLQHPAVKVQ